MIPAHENPFHCFKEIFHRTSPAIVSIFSIQKKEAFLLSKKSSSWGAYFFLTLLSFFYKIEAFYTALQAQLITSNGEFFTDYYILNIGTGFIIDPSGLLLTNYHIIKDSTKKIGIAFKSDEAENTCLTLGTVIGSDPELDIALMQCHPLNPLTAFPLNNSNTTQIADPVITIGNARGLHTQSLSYGFIVHTKRNLNNKITPLLQIDMTIGLGHSGAPVINQVGVITYGSSTHGFAIPMMRSSLFYLNSSQQEKSYEGIY